MIVTLKCFSHVRYALGADSLDVELEDGATAAELEATIRRRADGALEGVPLRVAVNLEFVEPGHVLRDGDEAALIPPVQGG